MARIITVRRRGFLRRRVLQGTILGDVTHSNRTTGEEGLGVDRFVDRRQTIPAQ
jgi:hypothetical protein